MNKNGRPTPNGVKNYICKVRLSREDLEILDKLAEENDETRSEILRRGIMIQRNMADFL